MPRSSTEARRQPRLLRAKCCGLGSRRPRCAAAPAGVYDAGVVAHTALHPGGCGIPYTGHTTAISLRPEMPTGPMNRVADNRLARSLLVWEPQVRFIDGLRQTVDWYFATRERELVAGTIEHRLTDR